MASDVVRSLESRGLLRSPGPPQRPAGAPAGAFGGGRAAVPRGPGGGAAGEGGVLRAARGRRQAAGGDVGAARPGGGSRGAVGPRVPPSQRSAQGPGPTAAQDQSASVVPQRQHRLRRAPRAAAQGRRARLVQLLLAAVAVRRPDARHAVLPRAETSCSRSPTMIVERGGKPSRSRRWAIRSPLSESRPSSSLPYTPSKNGESRSGRGWPARKTCGFEVATIERECPPRAAGRGTRECRRRPRSRRARRRRTARGRARAPATGLGIVGSQDQAEAGRSGGPMHQSSRPRAPDEPHGVQRVADAAHDAVSGVGQGPVEVEENRHGLLWARHPHRLPHPSHDRPLGRLPRDAGGLQAVLGRGHLATSRRWRARGRRRRAWQGSPSRSSRARPASPRRCAARRPSRCGRSGSCRRCRSGRR